MRRKSGELNVMIGELHQSSWPVPERSIGIYADE